jgi:dihydroflavonol-4-reductase
MAETVLVTGGTGFIAGWCIAELSKQGLAVRATLRDLAKAESVRRAVARAGASGGKLDFAAADLTRDAGWDEAVAGCDYVLHVASPLGNAPDNDLVTPAREGTLRVLRAAVKARVKRVVMTSAAAAARPPSDSQRVSDETIWADPDDRQFDAYRRSKILAERAAWDFMAKSGGSTELTTILPGAVFGPLLARGTLGSLLVIQRLLKGQPSRLPRLGFWVVDVRDLAALHVCAMKSTAAAGERFLATGDFLWLEEIASALRSRLGERAAKVPTRPLPELAVRVFGLFSAQIRSLTPFLGRVNPVTSAKARRLLGFAPRPATATVVECAESLLGARD